VFAENQMNHIPTIAIMMRGREIPEGFFRSKKFFWAGGVVVASPAAQAGHLYGANCCEVFDKLMHAALLYLGKDGWEDAVHVFRDA